MSVDRAEGLIDRQICCEISHLLAASRTAVGRDLEKELLLCFCSHFSPSRLFSS